MTIQQLQKELLVLSADEKLRLARWLLDTLLENRVKSEIKKEESDNSLLKIAGIFSGGPGDSADRAEEILASEVDPTYGLGIR